MKQKRISLWKTATYGRKRNLRLLFCLVCLLISTTSFALDLNDIKEFVQGILYMVHPDTGEIVQSVTLKTDVHIKVTGIILRGKVTQHFTNQSDTWMEGIYMFPLPENAAVDTLEMKIGERIIEGEIKEKEEAKQIYEEAKEVGKKASLVEQERPNIFTVSVANIGPDETIKVMIEYQQVVEYNQDTYSFTFPVVVGPRYIPLSMKGGSDPDNSEEAIPDMVTDPSSITAPIIPNTDGNSISLRIELNPGFPVKNINSPYLPIDIEKVGEYSFSILPQGKKATNRDFVLTWEPEDKSRTYTAIFNEHVNGDMYSLVMIHPQAPETINVPVYNREVIIIIDTSGSMQGTSIKQAKQALLTALDRLGPDDIFNIIEFNTHANMLFTNSASINYRTMSKAKQFVNNLQADGGTEMKAALMKALSRSRDQDRLFQVIFITDGCVGNEAELFTYIKKNIHNGRLFTVGIGSAPNHYFMRKAALVGRGTFLSIGSTSEVSEKMDNLFAKLALPVLTNLSLNWSNSSTDILPHPIPDIYAGEPLTICTQSYLDPGVLDITGNYGEQIWQASYTFSGFGENNGIGKLWARRKIEGLMDQLLEGIREEEIKPEIVDIALTHHLVSQYTSLVAVEHMKSKPDGQSSGSEKLPLAMPEGWEPGQSMGDLPSVGTEMWLFVIIGIALLCISSTYLFFRKKI